MNGVAAWIVATVLVLGPIALFIWGLNGAWRRFRDTVRPADDLLRADEDNRFPDGNSTSGWM